MQTQQARKNHYICCWIQLKASPHRFVFHLQSQFRRGEFAMKDSKPSLSLSQSMSAVSRSVALRGPYAESCAYNKFPIGMVFRWALMSVLRCGDAGRGARLLELGCGTGQHAIYFTHPPFGNGSHSEMAPTIEWVEASIRALNIRDNDLFDGFYGLEPSLLSLWQTTDLADELDGIRSNFDSAETLWGWDRRRCPDPVELGFTSDDATFQKVVGCDADAMLYDIVFTANTLHIAPWSADLELLQKKLALVLRRGGLFVCYGPFNYDGTYTSESNRRFDQWLKIHKSPQSAIRDFEAIRDALLWSPDEGCELVHDFAMPENNRCLVFRRK